MLVVDKPAGPTSHDVVDRVRRLLGTRKVGHSGTLDPTATGVLLVGVGRATRLLAFLQTLPKVYRAQARFGVTTATQDAAGGVLVERPCTFSREDLERAAASLTGEIEQTPPMVSAVKVAGERLYLAARRGEEVERPARTVMVHELTVEDFHEERWTATVFVRCSSGTYVRTIAADLGEAVGCGAHVESLRRLSVGSFGEREAVGLEELEEAAPAERAARLLPMSAAMRDFPLVTVQGADLEAVLHGRPLAAGTGAPDGPIAVLDPGGRLLAVYRRSDRTLKPAAVLA